MQHLAFINQLLNRSSDLVDWHFRIDPVLVKEIDAVGFKAL